MWETPASGAKHVLPSSGGALKLYFEVTGALTVK
jgi:hypothetical protein